MAKKKDTEFVEAEKIVDEEEFEEEYEDEEERTPRESGATLKWLKNNMLAIIFGIVGILVGVVIMACFWPERIAELSDGKQVALKYNNKEMTADDIYALAIKKGALNSILEEIDSDYLTAYYKDTLEEIYALAKEEADQYIAYYIETAGYSEEEFYKNMGFKDYDDMMYYLRRNALREQYVDDILNKEVTDADCEQFYKLYAFGDKTKVYLFFGENKDDLESVRKLLSQKKAFSDIDGKYSSVTAVQLDDTNFLDLYGQYGAEATELVKKLKNKEYTKVTKNVYYKYMVAYAEGTAETATYDAPLKEEIRTALVTEKKEADPNLTPKTLIEMRKNFGLEFKDTELAKAYEDYKKQYE